MSVPKKLYYDDEKDFRENITLFVAPLELLIIYLIINPTTTRLLSEERIICSSCVDDIS